MTKSLLNWHPGQAVHRPAAFLLGEKLDGRVLRVRAAELPGNCSVAVAWPDGTTTEEPESDLCAGALPAPQRSWGRRMRALLTA